MTILAFSKHLLFCAGLALLSAVVVRAMIAVAVLDQPDSRKAHARAVPKGGGVGVVVAFLVGTGLLYAFAGFARVADSYFLGTILAATAIAAVAFLDDLLDWPFTVKLGAQILAALVAVASGLVVATINLPVWGSVPLGWFGVPVTLAWILFATNAMNFIDGLNGLASGVTCLAAIALAVVAAMLGGWFVYFASLLLAAGLIGFLPFNFPRARIFMGDVGSQFCGFVLAVLGVVAARFEQVELSALLVPLLIFGVLYDVAFTLVRRAIAGDRLTQPHRSHLYQVAHRSGMNAVHITLVQWGFVLWGGGMLRVIPSGERARKAVGATPGAPAAVGVDGRGRDDGAAGPARTMVAATAWIAIALTCLGAIPARAQDAPNPSFYLVNRSTSPISRVFASPAGKPNWGANRLGGAVAAGGNAAIRLPADGECDYDLRVVFADGRSEERRNLNTCAIDNISFPQGRIVSATPAAPSAANPSFLLTNRSRAVLSELYLSPSGDDSWGEDRLGETTIMGGGSKTIRLPPGECIYDLRVVFANGEANEKRRLNLCNLTDLRVP